PYALSWKLCQEDSLNLPDHRYIVGVAASFQRSRIHKPHAHTQDFKLIKDSSIGEIDSPGAGYKPSGEEEKKDAEDLRNEDNDALSTEELRVNQEKDSVNSTNRVNLV
nr:hypothetical protein [Tanacetum cinerariifolium]GFB52512.1 hypothetical protein [Tanacetum cinerariifolium]